MSDWHDSFWQMVDSVVTETWHLGQAVTATAETLMQELNKTVEETTEELFTVMESTADELEQLALAEFEFIVAEIEETLGELSPLQIETRLESSRLEIALWMQDWDDLEFDPHPKVPATSKHHPACRGCQHYHGHRYQGNLLVCAMHPYGWSDETRACPDWEA